VTTSRGNFHCRRLETPVTDRRGVTPYAHQVQIYTPTSATTRDRIVASSSSRCQRGPTRAEGGPRQPPPPPPSRGGETLHCRNPHPQHHDIRIMLAERPTIFAKHCDHGTTWVLLGGGVYMYVPPLCSNGSCATDRRARTSAPGTQVRTYLPDYYSLVRCST
jgi:hypothetical protein